MSPEKTNTNPLRQLRTYLPYLTAPVLVALLTLNWTLAGQANPKTYLNWLLHVLEEIAPWILAGATGLYWAKAIFTRNLTYLPLTALAACLLLRELHWSPTIKVAIFPLLGICLLWGLAWRDLMDRPRENWLHTVFFLPAMATYALCQIVEKRLLRGLPAEDYFHSLWEEGTEVAAHLLLFAAALLGSWNRRTSAEASENS